MSFFSTKLKRFGPAMVEPLAATALFFSFAYVGRSILGLVAPIAVMLILAHRLPAGFAGFFRNLVTPFAPLIVVTLVASFFQETLSEGLALWAFAVTYLLARVARFVLSPSAVLFGAAFVGLVIALLRQFSLTPLVDFVPLLGKLAAVHERNPAGTVAAFGFVALLVLTWYLLKPRWLRVILSIWLVVSAVLVLISDVMTGVISAGLAAASLGGFSLLRYHRNRSAGSFIRPAFWLTGVLSAAVAGVVVTVINFASAAGVASGASVVDRDFTNLTGRLTIWTCYFDVVQQGLPQPWLETLECTGHGHANLHNTYLQGHLIAGVPGFLAAVFGFAVAVIISARLISRATNRSEALIGVMGLGFGVLGLVFGLAESYLFIYLYPAFFVFYAAPKWNIWPRSKHPVGVTSGQGPVTPTRHSS